MSTSTQQTLREYILNQYPTGTIAAVESCPSAAEHPDASVLILDAPKEDIGSVLSKFEALGTGLAPSTTESDGATDKTILRQLSDLFSPSGADAAREINDAEQAAVKKRQESLFCRTLAAVPSSCWPSLGTKGRDVQKLKQGNNRRPLYLISMIPTVKGLGGSQSAYINSDDSEWEVKQYERGPAGSWQKRSAGAGPSYDQSDLDARIRASPFWRTASTILQSSREEIQALEKSCKSNTEASATQIEFARLARSLDVVRVGLAEAAEGSKARLGVPSKADKPVIGLLQQAKEINQQYTKLSSRGRVPSTFEVLGGEFNHSSLCSKW